MSDYTRTTNFTAKDTLPQGDPNKIILGEEIQIELDNVATAITSKADVTELPVVREALVFPDTTVNVSHLVTTAIPCNREVSDTSGFHDNVTNNTRLTIPAGVTKVRLTANIAWDNDATGFRQAWIAKNGLTGDGDRHQGLPWVEDAVDEVVATLQNLHSAIVTVVAGDFFELVVFQNSGATRSIEGSAGGDNSRTWFAIEAVE